MQTRGECIEMNIAELRNSKLLVATPMYGGMCTGDYAEAMIGLMSIAARSQLRIAYHFLYNESLITRARAQAAHAFLESDCTHLVFIDADIRFDPRIVLTLLALQTDETPYDVIGAPCPKKKIAWEKVARAVRQGVADPDPNVLAQYAADLCFWPIAEFPLNRPAEVEAIGFGLTMIRRQTLERFQAAHPERACRMHDRRDHGSDERMCTAFFETGISPSDGRYLSEDYNFCREVRELGMRVWVCPWMSVGHRGSFDFKGSVEALASIGAPIGFDPGWAGNQLQQ